MSGSRWRELGGHGVEMHDKARWPLSGQGNRWEAIGHMWPIDTGIRRRRPSVVSNGREGPSGACCIQIVAAT